MQSAAGFGPLGSVGGVLLPLVRAGGPDMIRDRRAERQPAIELAEVEIKIDVIRRWPMIAAVPSHPGGNSLEPTD